MIEKNTESLPDSSFKSAPLDLNGRLWELKEERKILFHHSGDALFVVDPSSSEILEANLAATSLAGYPESGLRGKHLRKLFPNQKISTKAIEFGRIDRDRNGNDQPTVILQRPDGVSIPVTMRCRSIRQDYRSLCLVFMHRLVLENGTGLASQHPASAPNAGSNEAEPIYEFPDIIGRSDEIRNICQLIGQVAKTDSTVLIQGESGTGKEIVAKAIHFHSTRSKGPFVKLNCAALSETLLESELFGHVKGAFTGAIRDHKGRFNQADQGTILLDEINSMSLAGQAKFLRVLQEREFEPVGSSETKTVDVRVIVASNADLQRAVAEGRFREDLYYRLNVFSMRMPPLREKKEDIALLARHFLKKYNLVVGKQILDLTPESLALLMQYDWPGNVRELENALEYAVIVGKGSVILPCTLPANITMNGTFGEADCGSLEPGLRERLNLLEKQIILDVLTRTKGVKKRAAEMLQIDPRNFPYLLRKHDLSGKNEPEST